MVAACLLLRLLLLLLLRLLCGAGHWNKFGYLCCYLCSELKGWHSEHEGWQGGMILRFICLTSHLRPVHVQLFALAPLPHEHWRGLWLFEFGANTPFTFLRPRT
jgi:hypothetical protein